MVKTEYTYLNKLLAILDACTDGTLNVINNKSLEVRILLYRLLTPDDPVKGESIAAPFGLGHLKDCIPFSIHFNNPYNIHFTYTANNSIQTIYLKKIKDIPHGIIPLSRQVLLDKNQLVSCP